jgi:predicted O-methyltransferase YrrM
MPPHPLVRRAKEFAALQKQRELGMLLRLLEKHELRTVVEIGTATGGSLYCWCRLAEPNALVVSIDLPGGRFGGGCTPERVEEMKLLFPREGQKLHLVRGDSHQRPTIDEVNELLGEREIDFLFIDGDHTYDGVKQDFETYSPRVKGGGLIVLHDILEHATVRSCRVSDFWNEIKHDYRHREITTEPLTWGGIGVLWQR